MICLITIVPAVLALWAIFTQRWGVLLMAVGLYFLLCHLAKRSAARPCLRLVPMPSGSGLVAPQAPIGDVPKVGRRMIRRKGGGSDGQCV